MRLTVIGSSPAWPNPGGAHSGYLVESPGTGRLLLDCGPGVLSRLRTDGLLPVDAIAITHLHLDHWGDLVPWAWLTQYLLDGARAELWLPPGGIRELAAFGTRFGHAGMFEQAFEVQEYAGRTKTAAAGFELEALQVEHYGTLAFGFRVRAPDGCTLAYSGDAAPCPALAEIAHRADLFLCEATLAAGANDSDPRGHLSADEALEIADGPVLLTHRPAELALPSGARRATDGLVITV